MKRLTFFVACTFFLGGQLLANAEQDSLQANAASPVVQQALAEQPDGVSFFLNEETGAFQLFARGTASYDFNEADDIKDARSEATLRAKASIAKFFKEKIAVTSGMDEVTKKVKTLTKEGDAQNVSVKKESVKIMTEQIKVSSEALLAGVIVLREQKTPRGQGGEIQITVGVSSKTLNATTVIGKSIDRSLANRESAKGGAPAPAPCAPQENKGYVREAVTDF